MRVSISLLVSGESSIARRTSVASSLERRSVGAKTMARFDGVILFASDFSLTRLNISNSVCSVRRFVGGRWKTALEMQSILAASSGTAGELGVRKRKKNEEARKQERKKERSERPMETRKDEAGRRGRSGKDEDEDEVEIQKEVTTHRRLPESNRRVRG
jgi:hypothetical protein